MYSGEVKVNDQSIVKWRATLTGRAVAPGYSLFEVKAEGYHTSPLGTLRKGRWEHTFTVPANSNHGIYALTSIVMCELDWILKEKGDV
jgi:hypothetical protein